MSALFHGLEIQTVSSITSPETIKIDRAQVRTYQTVFGDVKYIVEGAKCDGVPWYPVSQEYDNPQDALIRCREIQNKIESERKLQK
jgi:hypothetical protein